MNTVLWVDGMLLVVLVFVVLIWVAILWAMKRGIESGVDAGMFKVAERLNLMIHNSHHVDDEDLVIEIQGYLHHIMNGQWDGD